LTHTVLQLLLQFAGGNGEQQHAHARSAVWCFVRIERAIDSSFAAAADYRGGKSRHCYSSLMCPGRAMGRDGQRGRPHSESFGEGVVDTDAIDGQLRHGMISNGSGLPIAVSATVMNSGDSAYRSS
jgi:hypothetical protein